MWNSNRCSCGIIYSFHPLVWNKRFIGFPAVPRIFICKLIFIRIVENCKQIYGCIFVYAYSFFSGGFVYKHRKRIFTNGKIKRIGFLSDCAEAVLGTEHKLCGAKLCRCIGIVLIRCGKVTSVNRNGIGHRVTVGILKYCGKIQQIWLVYAHGKISESGNSAFTNWGEVNSARRIEFKGERTQKVSVAVFEYNCVAVSRPVGRIYGD